MQTFTSQLLSVPQEISNVRDKSPLSVALSYGDRHLSYEELDRRADHFAGYLVSVGIVPGGTVAVCMERSFDLIIAALGIMRAGAAYVPLDSAWPDSRLGFAVKDSGATVLVARAALLDRLNVEAHGVDPSRDETAIATTPPPAPSTIQPESIAYVIYTSGSTGVPKGVEITHANLSNLVRWYRDTFGVTHQDRASHLLALGFDAAVLETWGHLCAGATLCLAEDAVRSSPELLRLWMVRERVTIGLVPTVLGARLMTMAWPEPTALRLLVTGGDVLHHGPIAELPFEVVNNYGPTECTVASTWTTINPGTDGVPPIGLPIAGASVYLLDEKGEPVPSGSVGEIYIGGIGVGRGYRNLPELTKDRFLPDPFSGATAARMYRTGDRGLCRADGQIEFHGRLDRQAKIRGLRVELDEIDSVLNRHPSIDFATATTRMSHTGENQLVAYVLPKKDVRVPTAYELQQQLVRFLPDYMVPAIFLRLNAIPTSPNGKLDLKMLPHPTDAQMLEGPAKRVPASPTEEKVLALVRELLENDSIFAGDSFFLAGGHSLLGMQLVMRIRNAFGVELTLRQLIESPTVELLALLIEDTLIEMRITAIWQDLLGRKNVGLDDDFFNIGGSPALVPSLMQRIAEDLDRQISGADLALCSTVRQQAELVQGRSKDRPAMPPGVLALQPLGSRNNIFWVHYLNLDLANKIGDDQPFLYVGFTAEDIPAPGEYPTIQSLAACLVAKIRAAQPNGPYIVGGWCLGGILSYEIASQLRAAGYEVSLLAMVDAPNPACIPRCNSMRLMVSYFSYVLRRATRLGFKKSSIYFREHLVKYFSTVLKIRTARTEIRIVQEMIEAAARAYRPTPYDGKVLLLLASERPPYVNLLPGWQAVASGNLYVRYLNAHHRDLLQAESAQNIAAAIAHHLSSAIGEKSNPCAYADSDQRACYSQST